MKPELSEYQLAPGLYRLTKDVTNPRGDKRVRWRFWEREIFKEGTTFLVDSEYRELDIKVSCIRPLDRYAVGCQSLFLTTANDDVLRVLIPNLEPMQKTLKSILLTAREHEHRISAEDVLSQLVLEGMTLENIEQIIFRAREREQRE